MTLITTLDWEMLGKHVLTIVQSHLIDFNNSVTKCQGTFLAKVLFGVTKLCIVSFMLPILLTVKRM